jgi:hypothetical protein
MYKKEAFRRNTSHAFERISFDVKMSKTVPNQRGIYDDMKRKFNSGNLDVINSFTSRMDLWPPFSGFLDHTYGRSSLDG